MKLLILYVALILTACSAEPAQALVLNDEEKLVPEQPTRVSAELEPPTTQTTIASDPAADVAPTPPKPKAESPKVDLNTATGTELEALPGIGPALAKRIIDYRTRRPFKRISDIRRVKGIGKAKYKKLRPLVEVVK